MKRLFFYLLILNFFTASAQVQIPSPNVGSFAERAVIPVNSFSGQADVQIPIYDVNYNDMNVPISLIYNTKGNKVKDPVGFTGLGWSLNAGGVIYRKKNSIVDENSRELGGTTYSQEINYYYNSGKVRASYNDYNAVKRYSLDGVNDISNEVYDGMPDQFIFNFNGYSGSFYITRDSETGPIVLAIKTNGNYALKGEILEIKDYLTFNDSIKDRNTNRCIYAIKLTDDKGFKYIFGNSPDNIEFGNPGQLMSRGEFTANAWHLAEIISPNNQKIEFSYERKGKIIIPDMYWVSLLRSSSYNFKAYGQMLLAFAFTSGSGSQISSDRGQHSSYYFSFPTYLKKIKTPSQEISFDYERQQGLSYDLTKYYYPNLSEILDVSEQREMKSDNYKLDKILISNLNKEIKFDYIEQATQRLKLSGLTFGVNQGNVLLEEKKYLFTYNPLLLPNFESDETDHWGYYNGRSRSYTNDYYSQREPDSSHMFAEILTAIKLPNKGYLNLEYEPHYYSKIATQFPFDVTEKKANILAGGARVKKIISKSNSDNPNIEREYFYVQDYVNGGQLSSGVLSGIPKYSNSGSRYTSYKDNGFWSGGSGSTTMHYQKAMDRNVFPMSNTNGNHVTYSEVTEKVNDGYITTTYTNHDNGYHDKAPSLMHSNFDSETFEDPFISLQSYRGLLLNSKFYSKEKFPQREVVNQYLIDINLESGIPFMQRVGVPELPGAFRASSGKYPANAPLLTSSEERNFYPGQNTAVSSSLFEYQTTPRAYYGILRAKTNTNSLGEVITKQYKYPNDFAFSGLYTEWVTNSNGDMIKVSRFGTNIYSKMVTANMVSLPIEVTTNLKPVNQPLKITSSLLTLYNDNNINNLILPEQQLNFEPADRYRSTNLLVTQPNASGIQYDNEYISKVNYRKYDNYGNLLEQQPTNGSSITYLYSYNFQYPIAGIRNADYSTIEGILGGASGISAISSAMPTDAQVKVWTDLLRTSPLLKDAHITSFTYKPFVGMTSQTDPKGMTTYYEYDEFQRLKHVKDQKGNILKESTYHYKN